MSLSLIIEEIDADTMCICGQSELFLDDIENLGRVIGINFEDDIEINYDYELSPEAMDALRTSYGLSGISGKLEGCLRRRNKLDDLPYRIHSRRELLLMLSGQKPMAFFVSFEDDASEIDNRIELSFRPHVISGKIHATKHVINIQFHNSERTREAIYNIYTIPNENWRARALILLEESSLKSGWSEGLVRMQGSLLGYEDWQNDVFLEEVFRPQMEK